MKDEIRMVGQRGSVPLGQTLVYGQLTTRTSYYGPRWGCRFHLVNGCLDIDAGSPLQDFPNGVVFAENRETQEKVEDLLKTKISARIACVGGCFLHQ